MSWDANWIAIDFGTTNTAVAGYQDATAEIVPNSTGRRLTPSVVSVTDTRTYLVGSAAVDRAIKQPTASVRSIKRHLGEDGYAVDLTGGEYQPEQVAAMILQKAKRDAENYLGEALDGAVLTVPAYFSDRQRQALKDAGDLAGFDGVRLISDPAATAMAYGLDDESDQTVLVYDLGGGTFSLGILDLGGGVYEVVATNGDNDLGGDDWDRALVDHLADEFESQHGVDLREDPQARQRLVQAAAEAKHELSTRNRTTVSLPFITETGDGPTNLEQKLTRAKFESLTSDLLERTVGPTKQALEDAGYDESDIDEVLLVGGSTRMPQVREKVEELTGQEPRKSVNPDEAVALGASVQAGIYDGAIDDVVLLDVTPLSLGVEVKGGLFERLIEKNTIIPTEESKIFTTAADNQTTVNVRVFQGEREFAEENELLGEFQLTGIPPASAGTPQIEVSFSIDENGIVNVEAEDKGSGTTEDISIQGGPGSSETELDRLRSELDELTLDQDHDAGGSTEGDQRQRERLEARDDAEAAIQRAETLLEEEAEVVDADLRGTIEGRMDDVASLLEAEDATVEEYEAATEALSEELQVIGKRMYQQQAEGGDTDGADSGGAPADSARGVEPGTAHIPAPETVASPPRRDLSYRDLTIETELGSGGQAVVQRARLVDGPPEYVALRQPVMPDTVTREAVDRFLTKADAWATIDAREREKRRWENYEHIVGVIDIDDQPWVAAEYMDGGDLGARLEANPEGLPVAEALWLGECLCKGVEIAHSVGIAHLDLKPENVLLRETDRWAWPKIADWGLARMLANDTGTMEGLSVEYAAPEQFDPGEFGDPDQLTDIYQIGKLVYALLTGDSPTTGSQYEVMQATMSDERIAPPSTRQAAVPPAADAALGMALERDKRARYESVSVFKNTLHAIRTGERLPRVVAARLDG